MSATLRPMNLGEILDRTFEIYRKRLLVFVGLAAMPAVAMVGVHLVDIRWLHVSSLVRPFRQPGFFLWSAAVAIGFEHVRALFSIPFFPALTSSASKAAYGEPDSILASLRAVAMRLRTYIWIGVLKLLAEMVIPEILAAGAFIGIGSAADAAGLFDDGSNLTPILLIVPPLAILIFLFLWLGACFSLAFPAAVFENAVGINAMQRSWKLSRNSRGRIVAVWLTIAVFGSILEFGLQMLYRRWMISTHAWPHLSSAWRITYYAGAYTLNAIVIAFVGSLYPIAITLIYYDQRIRREGYDIEKMMEAAGLGEAGAPASKVASIEAEAQEMEA
jgi:hypothetical protein